MTLDAVMDPPTRALHNAGAAGTARLELMDMPAGTTVDLYFPQGTTIYARVRKITTTGTTAGGLTVLF